MDSAQRQFVKTVKTFYAQEGRTKLPWRKTIDPYKVLVSEVMLQQTQVDRVLPKYVAFLKAFPNIQALAHAPLGEVLQQWQGLGYNRRAKMLHMCVQTVVQEHNEKFPRTHEALRALPGIGPYTAGAVMAFAYNQPVAIIETNIRTVYLHHFFADDTDVPDTALLSCVEQTLDRDDPRVWYWALMDYGAHLKRIHGNPNSRSASYTKQSAFNGSNRQIRGAIIRALSDRSHTRTQLLQVLKAFDDVRVDAQVQKLAQEGMIEHTHGQFALPS